MTRAPAAPLPGLRRRALLGAAALAGLGGFDLSLRDGLLNQCRGELPASLRDDPRLRDAASAQLEWVLGRNPLAKCFLTGVGHNPIRAPHHRPSFHLGAPIPGAVGEGPNAMNLGGDPVLKKLFAKYIWTKKLKNIFSISSLLRENLLTIKSKI